MDLRVGLGTLIALLALGITLGAFFAGKLQIEIPEEAWADLKMYLGLGFSFAVLAFSFYKMYFDYKIEFGEAWALSYLFFVVVLTLLMNFEIVPNPVFQTELKNRFTGDNLALKLSQILWASVAIKLIFVGVREL